MNRTFRSDESFWNLFPSARLGILTAWDVHNAPASLAASLLEKAVAQGNQRFGPVEELAKIPEIAVWRTAYKTFGAPKGNRSSVEALLRRVAKGKGLPSINPLVDCYNAVSLEYALPCGGEDLDRMEGDLVLTRAKGGEPFLPLGESEEDPPREGEVIYKDDAGAICRCWNWREAMRTRLTEDTVRAVLVIESLAPEGDTTLEKALQALEKHVRNLLGGKTLSYLVTRQNREIPLP
jgi:DNA/RNA-binding domain of Phe-tRNA-synthetase-like protein